MPKGLKRAASALLIAIALYSLLGFLILPGIGLRVANQQLAQYATLPAHLQRIELNPFSLELTLWGLQIGEPGKEQVGFERLYANLSLDSLWTKALHLDGVQRDRVVAQRRGPQRHAAQRRHRHHAAQPAGEDQPARSARSQLG